MSFQQPMLAPLGDRAPRDAKLLGYLVAFQHACFPKPTEAAFQSIGLTDVDNGHPSEAVTFA